MPTSSINITASKDASHPAFHLNFGKVLASVLLGLHAYAAVRTTSGKSSGEKATNYFTDPANATDLVNGFASIWLAPASDVNMPLAGSKQVE